MEAYFGFFRSRKHPWNRVCFVMELCFIPLALHWTPYAHLPPPGYSVAYIAIAAAFMSVHEEMGDWQKSLWLILIAAFLAIELRAIGKDRWDNQEVQRMDRGADQQSFNDIFIQQTVQFGAIIKEQQQDFAQTMKTFEAAQNTEQRDFSGVLTKEKELYDHEEQLAESTSGILIPDSLPTPDNYCVRKYPGKFAVLYGDNTAIVDAFPHTVIRSTIGDLIRLEKLPNGHIAVVMDVRDSTNKVVARLDESGYVIGSRLLIQNPTGAP